ncbi:MAG TPA: Crp/Fnr family transcriptional regulator [Candidatus Acidoferrum sp.]
MPEPMPEVPSAGSYARVAPIAASARDCNTLRKVRLVQHSPLFANIPPADCREIVSAARESKFSRRDTIFLEGDLVRHVTLLTSGHAKVTKLGQNGTEVILRLAGPGEIVEMTGLPDPRRHCSMAQALSASTALIWDASPFHALAERFPALRRNVLRVVAERMEELEERYHEISTEKVATRLSHQLLRLFNQLGRQVNGNGTLKINLSREELAQLTGTTLFTVSRLLSEWKERGIMIAGRECVSIHNIQALREFAETE